VLAKLFIDCFPNTLDTTVVPGTFAGKPDTAVLTGNIAATWPRDSSAQLWPYLNLAAGDLRLRALLEGAIRRQTRAHGLLRGANAIPGSSAGQPEWESADRMKDEYVGPGNTCDASGFGRSGKGQRLHPRKLYPEQLTGLYPCLVCVGEHPVW
jgi:hypothetical protein